MSENRVYRQRLIDNSTTFDRNAQANQSCKDAIFVQTYTQTSYPTSPGSYFACNVGTITGSEDEGATPTFTFDTDTTVYCLNVGSAIPASGTKLVAHLVGGRLTFRHDG